MLKYLNLLLIFIFVSYDIGAIGHDVQQIWQTQERSLYWQLGIDTGALGVDGAFLFLPGASGGGSTLRWAVAGGHDVAMANQAVQMKRVVFQSAIKGVQVVGQTKVCPNQNGFNVFTT